VLDEAGAKPAVDLLERSRGPADGSSATPDRLVLQADGNGWWRAEVDDRQIGRIRVDTAWGALASTSIGWTERYAPPLRSCAEIGHAVAWFGTPVAESAVTPGCLCA
jgi:hypothetical protein